MRKHFPFLLGMMLGPLGVLLSCLFLGRHTFLTSVKGVGVGCCIAFLFAFFGSGRPESQSEDGRVQANRTKRLARVADTNKVSKLPLQEHRAAPKPDQPGGFAQDRGVRETQEKLSRLRKLVISWCEKHNGVLPESLAVFYEHLEKGVNAPHRDAWGRRFIYECEDGKFALASAGADREFDTKDDLIVYADGSWKKPVESKGGDDGVCTADGWLRRLFGFRIGVPLSDRTDATTMVDGSKFKSYDRKLVFPFSQCKIVSARYSRNEGLLYRLDVCSEFYKEANLGKMKRRLDEMAVALKEKYPAILEFEEKDLSRIARLENGPQQELSINIEFDKTHKDARFVLRFVNADIRDNESGAKSLGVLNR